MKCEKTSTSYSAEFRLSMSLFSNVQMFITILACVHLSACLQVVSQFLNTREMMSVHSFSMFLLNNHQHLMLIWTRWPSSNWIKKFYTLSLTPTHTRTQARTRVGGNFILAERQRWTGLWRSVLSNQSSVTYVIECKHDLNFVFLIIK